MISMLIVWAIICTLPFHIHTMDMSDPDHIQCHIHTTIILHSNNNLGCCCNNSTLIKAYLSPFGPPGLKELATALS